MLVLTLLSCLLVFTVGSTTTDAAAMSQGDRMAHVLQSAPVAVTTAPSPANKTASNSTTAPSPPASNKTSSNSTNSTKAPSPPSGNKSASNSTNSTKPSTNSTKPSGNSTNSTKPSGNTTSNSTKPSSNTTSGNSTKPGGNATSSNSTKPTNATSNSTKPGSNSTGNSTNSTTAPGGNGTKSNSTNSTGNSTGNATTGNATTGNATTSNTTMSNTTKGNHSSNSTHVKSWTHTLTHTRMAPRRTRTPTPVPVPVLQYIPPVGLAPGFIAAVTPGASNWPASVIGGAGATGGSSFGGPALSVTPALNPSSPTAPIQPPSGSANMDSVASLPTGTVIYNEGVAPPQGTYSQRYTMRSTCLAWTEQLRSACNSAMWGQHPAARRVNAVFTCQLVACAAGTRRLQGRHSEALNKALQSISSGQSSLRQAQSSLRQAPAATTTMTTSRGFAIAVANAYCVVGSSGAGSVPVPVSSILSSSSFMPSPLTANSIGGGTGAAAAAAAGGAAPPVPSTAAGGTGRPRQDAALRQSSCCEAALQAVVCGSIAVSTCACNGVAIACPPCRDESTNMTAVWAVGIAIVMVICVMLICAGVVIVAAFFGRKSLKRTEAEARDEARRINAIIAGSASDDAFPRRNSEEGPYTVVPEGLEEDDGEVSGSGASDSSRRVRFGGVTKSKRGAGSRSGSPRNGAFEGRDDREGSPFVMSEVSPDQVDLSDRRGSRDYV